MVAKAEEVDLDNSSKYCIHGVERQRRRSWNPSDAIPLKQTNEKYDDVFTSGSVEHWNVKISSLRIAMQIHSVCSLFLLEAIDDLLFPLCQQLGLRQSLSFVILIYNTTQHIESLSWSVTNCVFTFVICAALMMMYVCLLTASVSNMRFLWFWLEKYWLSNNKMWRG